MDWGIALWLLGFFFPPLPSAGPAPTWGISSAPKPCAPLSTTNPCGFKLLKSKDSVHAPVYLAKEEHGTYNHAVMMDYFDGFFLLSWKNSPQDEEQPGQRVLYSTSDDGFAWSPTDGTNILFPNVSTAANPAHLFAEPSVIVGDRRYATATFSQFSAHPTPNPGAMLMRQVFPDKTMGPIFWAAAKPWEQFLEGATLAGVKLLHEMDAQTQADAGLLFRGSYLPCGFNHSLKCEAVVGDPLPARESGFWNVPNSEQQVVMFRHRGPRQPFQWSIRESPSGQWSEVRDSNFPDIGSNLNAGQLPSGAVYVLSNACPKVLGPPKRDPLVVSLAEDGILFTRAFAISTCHMHLGTCVPRFPGSHKDSGPSYPQGVTVVGKGPLDGLYVSFSNNKEDIWVTKVPYHALTLEEEDGDSQEFPGDGGELDNINDLPGKGSSLPALGESFVCRAAQLMMQHFSFSRYQDFSPGAAAGCCTGSAEAL
mmetsp:Transcript_16176/g.45074  ORF Transcript_16176/g.45074 Transcript_16176/m.45074 type:complete len:479 (+) Transcript_16176:133-1569(+)|eukprot:CAMPEP_0117670394 /NCGR_PEP_ID=MMETSP0804-20121206/12723_1 /TAXON_ID=1074897 /ORGANISM="Tetraselmis astigmatica, Strain CCMP880" /LENGTH=478 /DNA_ID=CAMNT_0005478677 /DNA_START=68 /DNA_END=1504 /DNA_ORIENTATION=-